MPTFGFMAGLPRSGSTLLSSLIMQRPDVHVSGVTSSADALSYADLGLAEHEAYALGTNRDQRDSLLRNMLPMLYAHVSEPWIVDTSRTWGTPHNIGLLRKVLGYEPKIIAPHRPLTEIVASFIRLCRNQPGNYIDRAVNEANLTITFRKPIDDVRLEYLLGANGHLGIAMFGMWSVFLDEYRHNFHPVSYSDLTGDTRATLAGIEAFMGWEPFDYDLTGITGLPYNDDALGMKGMHDIRPIISRRDPAPGTVLSEYAMSRCLLEDFWTDKL